MKENIEYTKMAYLYDKFYQNKNYDKEVDFIKNFIKNQNVNILDAGCGTGSHAKILYNLGYNVYGFDLNKEMIEIANSKVSNHFFVGNILNYKSDKKLGLILSFYAVFNHLKTYKEFELALINLKNLLTESGTIIIDLHNPQNNGTKVDKVDNATRIMKWHYCRMLKKEFTKLTYLIDNKSYISHHTFKIFKIGKLQKLANKLGFKTCRFYENYNLNTPATNSSKNIQMVLEI